MIIIDKKTLLKDSPDYEDYTKNVVKEESKKGCNCKSGGCCKNK